MMGNPFTPQSLVGRQLELQQVVRILADDDDLVLTGVPGSGRRLLLHWAARQVGARVLELDCIRATNTDRFLQLLAEGLVSAFADPTELVLMQRKIANDPLTLEQSPGRSPRFIWHLAETSEEWSLFQRLLALLQGMAEAVDCRVVLVFQNFTHIRSWDRAGEWEGYLRQEIQHQSRVSYALMATVAEPWMMDSQLRILALAPLQEDDLKTWIVPAMVSEGLQFDKETQALALFLDYVRGHLGDAIALARRIWLECRASEQPLLRPQSPFPELEVIQAHHVHRSMLALAADLSITFESLILLLPPAQVRVLESLALDPTDSPHSKDYIQKHHLSKGGGLQGALASLEQKGLVYGVKYGYQVASPLLAFWLQQRLG
jgi:hypothetical protein